MSGHRLLASLSGYLHVPYASLVPLGVRAGRTTHCRARDGAGECQANSFRVIVSSLLTINITAAPTMSAPATMKAVVYTAPHTVELVEKPIPVPGEGEVLC